MFKVRAVSVSAIMLCIVGLSGCASIINGSSREVHIKSSPDGAEFTIRNKAGEVVISGTTPQKVLLKSGAGYFRSEAYNVSFRKPGYSSQTTAINTSLSGWYWGNLLLGGLIGMLAVDPVTGAMYKLPDEAVATLQAETSMAPVNGELMLVTVDQVPEHLRGQLVPLR